MTIEIALVFLITAGGLYLFASQKLPIDVTAMTILTTVMAIPQLFHSQWLMERGVDLKSSFPSISESLSGFSSTATVTVLCMFILSGGIQRSGMVNLLAKKLIPLIGNSETRQIIVVGVMIGLVSGFINNTAAVAMAIPLMLNLARNSDFKASRVLIPLSFFGMMGGTLTLVGTSTNILTSSILADAPSFGRPLMMFEFTHIGTLVLLSGLVYFLFIGRWLLPKEDANPVVNEEEQEFVTELTVNHDSKLVGKTLEDANFEAISGVEVKRLIRGGKTWTDKATETEIKPDDVIIVCTFAHQIMDLIKEDGVDVLSEFNDSGKARTDTQVVQVLLRNRLLFDGRKASKVDLWRRFNAHLIGLGTNEVTSTRLADQELHVGEVVLLDISKTALKRLQRSYDVVLLDQFEDEFSSRRMITAGGIVAAVIFLAVLTPMPIVLTAIAGVIAMAVTGCIPYQEMYEDVSWSVIFLLAGVIPLGIAMTKSGAADWAGSLIAQYAGAWHPIFILMALYAMTTVLTEIVSNNASAVILVPVAISLSQQLALEPLALVMAIMFAASTSFLSPIGYQTNTMIYGTGAMKFTDFARVGAPLNLMLMVVTSCAIYWTI
ncbi:SLC13 family permease [Halomonas sp. 11-S5]|uniref:SLC13 family permease n=1 Tax=Halomonas sp. 11-S5 TaxID=2994064 RepID=UPI0024686A8E|nr:SLC13 family permease [Halomonas sp. 11-S5]